jgi:hypothetical protein
MAKDNQINVRVNDRTNEAIENFAEDKDYIKTEAVRRMVEGRLAGEGYLEGVAVSDGGQLVNEIETNRTAVQQAQNELENTRSEVSNLSEEIEEFKSSMKIMAPSIFVSLFWIGATSAVDFPSNWLVGTGLAVIGFLLLSFYFVGRDIPDWIPSIFFPSGDSE